jgi:uncharacterized protein with PQ loop repeat
MKSKNRRILGYKKIDSDHNAVDDRLDWITNVCSVVLPFTTLHQLYLIYVLRETAGVSGITWLLYAVLSVPLFIYSLQRKDTPMIILNGLWVLVDALVWLGVVLYG